MHRLMVGKEGNDGWGSTDPKISGLNLVTEFGNMTLCNGMPWNLLESLLLG